MNNSLLAKMQRNTAAIGKVYANAAQQSFRSTFQDLQNSNGNTKHTNAWNEYGYPETVTFDLLYKMWERFGIARAGIELPVNYGWMDNPVIKEGTKDDITDELTEWEKVTARFFKTKDIFNKLKGADRRNRIGDYSAFLVQIASDDPDEVDWAKPLSSVTLEKVLRFLPVNQGQLRPNDKADPKNPRYPMPNNYTFLNHQSESDVDTFNQKHDSFMVHHSRVIIFAEGADDNTLNGIPVNRNGYNALLDLEKVSGAGSEGFWLAISQKLALSSGAGRAPKGDELDNIDKSMNDALTGFNKHFMVGGFDVTPINASMPSNYKDPFTNALNIYAASVSIPATILIGAQTGRLASDEDGKHLAMMANSRRNNWQTEMINSVIEWLDIHTTDYNVPLDYCVEWPDLLESTLSEKVDVFVKLADGAQKLNSARMLGETAITEKEAREVIGLPAEKEAEDIDMKTEAMPDGEPE